MKTPCGLDWKENRNCGGRDDVPFDTCHRCWARAPQSFYRSIVGTSKVDFVIVMDELESGGKVKISPVSGEANSFGCPRCGSLISPDAEDSFRNIGDQEHPGMLIECTHCKARIKLLL